MGVAAGSGTGTCGAVPLLVLQGWECQGDLSAAHTALGGSQGDLWCCT